VRPVHSRPQVRELLRAQGQQSHRATNVPSLPSLSILALAGLRMAPGACAAATLTPLTQVHQVHGLYLPAVRRLHHELHLRPRHHQGPLALPRPNHVPWRGVWQWGLQRRGVWVWLRVRVRVGPWVKHQALRHQGAHWWLWWLRWLWWLWWCSVRDEVRHPHWALPRGVLTLTLTVLQRQCQHCSCLGRARWLQWGQRGLGGGRGHRDRPPCGHPGRCSHRLRDRQTPEERSP
jgi:hypothetical protein